MHVVSISIYLFIYTAVQKFGISKISFFVINIFLYFHTTQHPKYNKTKQQTYTQ